VLFALVASEPSAPRSPYLIRSTSNQITLGLFESDFNGGSKVTSYELWRDNGINTEFIYVDSYYADSLTYTITSGVVPGEIYTFKARSLNSVGFSNFSTQVQYAIAMPP
jgi:hypothetical protein